MIRKLAWLAQSAANCVPAVTPAMFRNVAIRTMYLPKAAACHNICTTRFAAHLRYEHQRFAVLSGSLPTLPRCKCSKVDMVSSMLRKH
eukprot:6375267-Amphidinium_carterae.1